MDAQQFRAILKGEVLPEEISLEELNEQIQNAPYSASLYVLRAIASHAKQEADFETHLQKAAARTLSRSRLKEVIEGPVKLEFDWLPSDDTVLEEAVDEQTEPEITDATEETETAEIPEAPALEPEMVSDPEPLFEEVDLVAVSEPEKEVLVPQPAKPSKNEFGFGFVKVP
ncbi:MAG TPA: hypothetical protein PLK63_07220, partial [Catalimonadaceae bacterium]|nr:hypothetical protein [Catalimonadaceae bacterium]